MQTATWHVYAPEPGTDDPQMRLARKLATFDDHDEARAWAIENAMDHHYGLEVITDEGEIVEDDA